MRAEGDATGEQGGDRGVRGGRHAGPVPVGRELAGRGAQLAGGGGEAPHPRQVGRWREPGAAGEAGEGDRSGPVEAAWGVGVEAGRRGGALAGHEVAGAGEGPGPALLPQVDGERTEGELPERPAVPGGP